MNVTVEELGPCKKLLRFDVEPQQVDEQFEKTTKEFTRHASLPGFRAGKAPRDMILRKFEKEIGEEVKRKLMSDAYRNALKERNLSVVGQPDIEEVQFGRGQPFQFIARLEIVPHFELPTYRNLPAKREKGEVTDPEIDQAIEALRAQQAKFEAVDRPAQSDDIVVVNYTGTSDDKPITELAPTARGLTEQKNFWIEIKPGAFLPGFSEQLTGAKAGEKRTVHVDFPADFLTTQLAGKKGVYQVEVVEVKQRNLPALDDEFAKSYGAENVGKLREGVRADLQNEINLRRKRSIRNQVVRALLDRVNFELPESTVEEETRRIVYELVEDYRRKGIANELIEQERDQVYAVATRNAKERVKLHFLIQRIAEREGIRVSREELTSRLVSLATQYQMPVEKFAKEVEKRNGLQEIHSQMIHEKVIDFLAENASLEDVEREQVPS